MSPQQRLVGVLLVMAIAIPSSATSGCTSMKRIRVAAPGALVFGAVKPGDVVAVRLEDGRQTAFVVGSIEGETITATSGERYERQQIQQLRRRSTSALKTSALIAGIAVGTFFAVAAVLFATWDGPFAGR